MTENEHHDWVRRFVIEFQRISGHPKKVALRAANASWESREELEEDVSPEEYAQSEYSYWTEDAR